MKPFLVIIFGSLLLAGIACGSSAPPPISDIAETSVPPTVQAATNTASPTSPPTAMPELTMTPTPTDLPAAEPTPTKTVTPNTIAQAAKSTNPGVPIVERGDLGAQAKEQITVQLAIDSMMIANLMTKVTPNTTADYIRAEGVAATDTDFGGGQSLFGYTRAAFTAYCYTWDSNGTLIDLVEPGIPPCGLTP